MSPAGRAATLALACLLAGPAAHAQAARTKVEPAPAAEPPPPPYEPQLLKLAEIIGSLAYLHTLCAARDATGWRERMTALIEAEGRTPARRERLTGAYNRGFRAYALTHRTCTPVSGEALGRLAAEGEKLSRELAGRYGG